MTLAATGPDLRATAFASSPYPGAIPPWSYCIEDGRVRRLTPACDDYVLDDGQTLTNWLASRYQDYAPVLAYGSNACPGRLVEKFQRTTSGDGCVLLQATLFGAVKVWSTNSSSAASIPLTLADAPGEHTEVHLMLIPSENTAEMDRSEGRGGPFYKLARLKQCTLKLTDGTVWESPLAYVGHNERGPLVHSGGPVTYADFDQDTALKLAAECGPGSTGGDKFLPAMIPVASDVSLMGAVSSSAERHLLRWLTAAGSA